VVVGSSLLIMAQRMRARAATNAKREAITQNAGGAVDNSATVTTEQLMEQMKVHALEIMLSPDLVDIVSDASDDLLARVRALRRKIAMDLGVVVPPVRTRDNIELPAATYVIRIAGVEAGRGVAPAGKVLALGESLDSLPGTTMIEPVFGLTGKWVPAESRYSAEMTGATVIDRVSVIVTHLSSIITNNAARLLTREDVRVLTEGVRETSPSAVEELIPNLLSLAEVQRVLQGLLLELIPINDLPRIYEALSLRAKVSNDPEGLIEAARIALGPALTAQYLDGQTLRVIMIDPGLEQQMLEGLRPSDLGTQILMDQGQLEGLLGSVKDVVDRVQASGLGAVLVCAPALRPAIHRLIASQPGGLPVLSYQEVTSSTVNIETVGVVRIAESISA
jgi:flagellar biosynthesis protein FlhA